MVNKIFTQKAHVDFILNEVERSFLMITRVALVFFVGLSFLSAAVFAGDEPNAAHNSTNTHDFIVAGGDGYGTSDCLATTSSCGRIVADSWCESKGYAKSVSYRIAGKDETTASVGNSSIDQAFVITCSAQ